MRMAPSHKTKINTSEVTPTTAKADEDTHPAYLVDATEQIDVTLGQLQTI